MVPCLEYGFRLRNPSIDPDLDDSLFVLWSLLVERLAILEPLYIDQYLSAVTVPGEMIFRSSLID